jgi:hypothetical protein
MRPLISLWIRARAPLAQAFAIFALAGCGTNNADVPQGLLDAVRALNQPRDGGPGGATYPPPPYGTKQGSVVQDLCFQGWTDPSAADYDPTKLKQICLSDFHADPDARLLLIESCAIWCVACKFEYGGSGDRPSLAEQLEQRKSKGFRVFGTIFQNGASNPASPNDAAQWTTTFSLSFPFAVDDEHKVGLFSSPNVAPFNMLVDTRTMQIVLALEGDEPAVLFGKVDQFLGQSAK